MCGTDLLGCRLVAAPRESLSLDRRSCLASLRVTSDRREDALSLASSVRNALSTRLLVCFTRGKRLENGWHERETSAKGRETQALFLSRGSQGISCRASLHANKCVCVCTQYDAKKGGSKGFGLPAAGSLIRIRLPLLDCSTRKIHGGSSRGSSPWQTRSFSLTRTQVDRMVSKNSLAEMSSLVRRRGEERGTVGRSRFARMTETLGHRETRIDW